MHKALKMPTCPQFERLRERVWFTNPFGCTFTRAIDFIYWQDSGIDREIEKMQKRKECFDEL